MTRHDHEASPIRRWIPRLLPPLGVLVLVVAGWYALAYSLDNNFASGNGAALIIPPPHELFVGFNQATWDRIIAGTWVSLGTTITGFILSVVLGLVLGVAMAKARALEAALWPWLIVIQVTPVIVLTPIIVRIAGSSFSARVAVTVLISFFPIASNTLFGIRAIPQGLRDVFWVKGASSWERLFRLDLPAASPAIFAGVRVSSGLSVIGAIVGDFFFTRGTPGLGRLITFFFQDTRSGPMFVTAMIASLIGIGMFVLVTLVRTLVVSPWHRG
jgi:NitT/TauT family transport system permease protein